MQTQTSINEAGTNGHDVAPGAQRAAADAALAGVSREFHNFIADVEDLVKATTSLTGEDLARAKAMLGERIAAARASLEHAGGIVVERARQTARATDGFVHAQPWQSVGIGAALGLLIGLVLGRR